VFLPILGVFGASAIRLVPATGRILSNLQNLKFSKVSTLAISKNLDDYRVEEKKNKDKILEFSFKKEIVFENITFKHENKSENILENIDLKISKGETIGIIGESGSGKSTLIDILLGLNSTPTGSVLVDNLNINENIVGWRKNIGYVSQNLFLIDDSIEKNITFLFNNEPYVQEKLNKVIKDVQLNRFIEKLPKGIKTEVGERGLRISGGEKQRIVIARILFNNPDVLIFDESTNALDLETEKKIIDLIHDLKSENKTIIFVSHRKSTLEKCDSIYLLKDKKLELKK
jgi:ATP-binding cassette subfamily C protein